MSKKKIFLGYFIVFLSILSLFIPLTCLFIHNYDIWVKQDATKITMGVMLGLIYAIFVLKGALKEISSKLATLLSMAVFAGVVWFLDSMIKDLFVVILMIIIGYVLYLILSTIGNRMIKNGNVYREEKIRTKARREAREDEMLGV